jgi:surface protein
MGRLEVSRATNMHYMFEQASAFDQDISGWNVAKVTDVGIYYVPVCVCVQARHRCRERLERHHHVSYVPKRV